MGKGRTKEDGDGSRQVRVFEDVGEMISWIVRLEGMSTASLLDPMIRPQIVARYERHRTAVEKIKAAEEELRKVEEAAKLADAEPERKRKRGE